MSKLLLCASMLLVLAALPAQNEIRPGPWQTAAKVPDGWITHNTKNYHIQSQCGIEKAKRLGNHMEVMNAAYRRMFKPDKDGAKLQTIKLFKNQAGYLAYGARLGITEGAAAYYAPGEREMVCYDSGKWSDEQKPQGPITGGDETPADRLRRRLGSFEDMMKMDLLGTAAHEGWHQYYHWLVVSRVALPSWINEGMGDYFYTAAPKAEKNEKGGKGTRAVKAAELGRIFDGRLMILKAAKSQDRMEPLAKFITMLQADYYSNPSVCYAQGWAFCQFLLHGANGKYAKVIPTYVRLLCNDTNWQSVQAKAFKGVDLAVMETEFHAYIDSIHPSAMAEFEGEQNPAAGDPPTPPQPPANPPAGEPNGGGGAPPAGSGGDR